jgi:uncharacterized membrane protein YphA (DoxX/SURF4 family)
VCDDRDPVPQQSGGKYIGGYARAVARVAIAGVWVYEGLWCKLLGGCPSHAAIVSALSRPFGNVAPLLLTVIGTVEVVLAVWVVSGWRSRLAAIAQTALLIVMNTGGLLWGRSSIADPATVVLNNIVLITLAWIVADERT